jgi:hypothetical protein
MQTDRGAQLVATGRRFLQRVEPQLRPADPDGSIRLRSRILCCGLAELALSTRRALGSPRSEEQVGDAAALLSLLTKLDDEVIDDVAFHGGRRTDRSDVRRRTKAWLAPTFESIRTGQSVDGSARCALAATLGRSLRALATDDEQLARQHGIIARGWAIQVDAVATLSADPATVTLEQVDRVTAEISGAWLMMIAQVGALGAPRMFSQQEQQAFFSWGLHIQRADALCDLDKDLSDGLITTSPGWRAWERDPVAFLAAVDAGRHGEVFALLAKHDADLSALPSVDAVAHAHADLAGLGGVPDLLGWIHRFLVGRYVRHPLYARDSVPDALAPYVVETSRAITPVEEIPCSAS